MEVFTSGRFEASYRSGSTYGVGAKESYYKPFSSASTATRTKQTESLSEHMLWNFVSQRDASFASRNMYYDNDYVTSDLVNSFMWDTTVVYLQEMGNENIANATSIFSEMKNTGTTGDVLCNIYDLIYNLSELTTEYCTDSDFPFTSRGWAYTRNLGYTSRPGSRAICTGLGGIWIGFRIGLWVN